MTYLRARLHEKGTWLGLALVLAAIGVAFWYERVGVKSSSLAALGAIVAAVPSDLRWLWPKLARFAIVRVLRSTEPAPAVPIAIPPKDPPAMSLSSDILAEVEKQIVPLFKAELDKVVAGMGPNEQAAYADIQAVAEAPTTLGVLKLGADLLAVMHDVTVRAQAAEASVAAQSPAGGVSPA